MRYSKMSWATEALDRLRAMHIPHRNYESTRADLRSALVFADAGELIHLVGPTGVGKSFLVKQVLPLVMGPNADAEGQHMPVVFTSAVTSNTNGTFSTRDFALGALTDIAHPIYGIRNSLSFDRGHIRFEERASEPQLRRAFVNSLEHRKVKLWVIDELQELLKIARAVNGAKNYLDSLKCLATATGIRIAVLSTYELLEPLQLSTHLLRRKMQIHFCRYRHDVRDDLIAFDQILKSYSEILRFDGATSLRDWNEYLFGGSLGCIGLLRPWIRDALRMAWTSRAKGIRLDHFVAQRRSDTELARLEADIQAGEALLDNSQRSEASVQAVRPSQVRRNPFRRKPRRDPVGNGGIR